MYKVLISDCCRENCGDLMFAFSFTDLTDNCNSVNSIIACDNT